MVREAGQTCMCFWELYQRLRRRGQRPSIIEVLPVDSLRDSAGCTWCEGVHRCGGRPSLAQCCFFSDAGHKGNHRT